MIKEKWLDLKSDIKDKFKIEEEFSGPPGEDIPGVKETIIFTSPLGKIKLEWVEKPRTIGEKTTFSQRVGSHVRVEKKYDTTDLVSYMNAFKFDTISGDWLEIKTEIFS